MQKKMDFLRDQTYDILYIFGISARRRFRICNRFWGKRTDVDAGCIRCPRHDHTSSDPDRITTGTKICSSRVVSAWLGEWRPLQEFFCFNTLPPDGEPCGDLGMLRRLTADLSAFPMQPSSPCLLGLGPLSEGIWSGVEQEAHSARPGGQSSTALCRRQCACLTLAVPYVAV